MSPLDLIPPQYKLAAELILIALITAIAAGGLMWFSHHERDIGRAEVQAKWDAERVALQAQMQIQKERNLELQRQAEKHYTVQAETREKVITRIITEVRDATTSLASCPVPEPAIRLLNDAAGCASTDSPASCGAGDAVRPPG